MKGWLSSVRAARPSFLDGIASILDFGGTLADPYYAPAFESDADAFAHDWRMLEADFDRMVSQLADEEDPAIAAIHDETDQLLLNTYRALEEIRLLQLDDPGAALEMSQELEMAIYRARQFAELAAARRAAFMN